LWRNTKRWRRGWRPDLSVTLEWLGTATYRLTIGDLVVFLDAYMDRVPMAPPVGLSAADVTKADLVLVGHSHFDHLAGAEVIAANTGAKIIGSNESCRVMRERGVGSAQLLPSQGGERHRLADGVTVRVFPSLHACTWILSDAGPEEEQHGHTGLTQDERMSMPGGLVQRITEFVGSGTEESRIIMQHIQTSAGSLNDGGPLVYLIETPETSIFFQDTSGCWTGVLSQIQADTAILAASARPDVDGEPIQGSTAGFIAMEAKLLGATKVVLGHHDNWMPPITNGDFDTAPIRERLAAELPGAEFIERGYLDPIPL
jgi:L-ascorbate metabolism protein UlaG (beta-lactamase superfamily)